MRDIIFVPFPLPEESPSSLLRRFAIHHGCEIAAQLSAITTRISFSASALSRETRVVQWISEHAGEYSTRFLEGFYQPLIPHKELGPFEIHGTVVPNRLIRFAGFAFCSECWKAGYERSIKDFKPCLYCPYHRRRYLFGCPQCKRSFFWFDALHGKCRCGHELICEHCSVQNCAPEAYLLSCLQRGDSRSLKTINETLIQLQHKPRLSAEDPLNRLIFETAISIVKGDRRGIRQFLTRLQTDNPDIPARVIAAKLSLVKHPTAREVMNDFIDANKSPLDESRPNQPPLAFSLRRIQIREAAAVRSSILKRIILELNVDWSAATQKSDVSADKFMPILLSAWSWKERARDYTIDETRQMTLEGAAEAMQIDLCLMKTLIRLGFFERTSKPNQVARVPIAEVNDFVDKYESVSSLAARLKVDIKAARHWIQNHRIRPLSIAGSQHVQIIFKSDVDRVLTDAEETPRLNWQRVRLADLELVAKGDYTDFYTCAQAAKKLKLAANNLRQFVHAGILFAKKCAKCILIPRVEFESFHKMYILPAEYSKLARMTKVGALKTFQLLGLQLIANWRLNHCDTNLFLRAEVENATRVDEQLKSDIMPIQRARQLLKLSDGIIVHLIRNGDLALNENATCKAWASATKVKNFDNTYINSETAAAWCNVPVRIIQAWLFECGITPVAGSFITGQGRSLYSRQDVLDKAFKIPGAVKLRRILYQSFTHKKDRIHLEVTLQLPYVVPASLIFDQYKIHKSSFTRIFIHTGYVKTLSVGSVVYLKQTDADKVCAILDEHCTVPMVNALRGTKSSIHQLCHDGKLEISQNLPAEFSNQIFVTRASVEKFLGSLLPRKP